MEKKRKDTRQRAHASSSGASTAEAASLGHLGAIEESAAGSAVGTLEGCVGAAAAVAGVAEGTCEGSTGAVLGAGARLLGTCEGSLLAGAAPLPSALGTLLGDGGISLTCTTSGSSAPCPNFFLNHARMMPLWMSFRTVSHSLKTKDKCDDD